jgi:uncharacterized coiled-coil DUF342 family protein
MVKKRFNSRRRLNEVVREMQIHLREINEKLDQIINYHRKFYFTTGLLN